MSTTTGRRAEAAAAEYLKKRGFKILSLNWRNRYSEIDIVAIKPKKILRSASRVHLVEVKYRQNAISGSGIEYITPKKLNQMELASAHWTNENNWPGEICLNAIEIVGPRFRVSKFIEL